MALDLAGELARLRELTVEQLRALYQDAFGESAPSHHKHHLVRRIVWRLQAVAQGGLSERARQRAHQLVPDGELRIRPPHPRSRATARVAPKASDARLPMPGTILVRRYRGRTLQVRILGEGFEYDGQKFRSLTAVARQISGQHWNGYHFFGLGGGKGPE